MAQKYKVFGKMKFEKKDFHTARHDRSAKITKIS